MSCEITSFQPRMNHWDETLQATTFESTSRMTNDPSKIQILSHLKAGSHHPQLYTDRVGMPNKLDKPAYRTTMFIPK